MKKRRFDSSLNEHWTWKGTKMVAKRQFQTHDEAIDFMHANNIKNTKYKAYECSVCGLWHIGHRKK